MQHKIETAYDAYWFLYNHPRAITEHPEHPITDSIRMEFGGNFIYNLDIFYTKVDPDTNRVEDDTSRNTKIACWLETGPAQYEDFAQKYINNVHDYHLDTGGDTFDEALIKLAKNVLEVYGDYYDG